MLLLFTNSQPLPHSQAASSHFSTLILEMLKNVNLKNLNLGFPASICSYFIPVFQHIPTSKCSDRIVLLNNKTVYRILSLSQCVSDGFILNNTLLVCTGRGWKCWWNDGFILNNTLLVCTGRGWKCWWSDGFILNNTLLVCTGRGWKCWWSDGFILNDTLLVCTGRGWKCWWSDGFILNNTLLVCTGRDENADGVMGSV